MHFRQGFRDWWNGLTRIANETDGIERVVGELATFQSVCQAPLDYDLPVAGQRADWPPHFRKRPAVVGIRVHRLSSLMPNSVHSQPKL